MKWVAFPWRNASTTTTNWLSGCHRAGWKGKKLPVTLMHHFHGQNRSQRKTPADEQRITASLFTAWRFAFP